MTVIKVYKFIGETPVQVVNRIKQSFSNKSVKIAFSGRLDPLAHGFIYILIGDSIYKALEYNSKSKSYRYSITLGLSTDTTDILGSNLQCNTNIDMQSVVIALMKLNRVTFMQKYHKWSSKTVNTNGIAIPCWKLSLDGIPFEQPTHEITIFWTIIKSINIISGKKFKEECLYKLKKVLDNGHKGFRTESIIEQWKQIELPDLTQIIVKSHVSSGTYIRQIVQDISDYMNVPLLVNDIYRSY
jgi:tRNA pseudouridine(55) synthase